MSIIMSKLCVHGHELKIVPVDDEVLSIAAEQYICTYCGVNYIFCKICEIYSMPARNIMYGGFIYYTPFHMEKQHYGTTVISMYGYDFMFPSYYLYLNSKMLYNSVDFKDTEDELKKIMNLCEYNCIACGHSYDSIPSKEVVIGHMKKCITAKFESTL